MGQAIADLPASTTPESETNADALLSQLAGEEIDRLLAEADISKADSVPPEVAPPAPMVDPDAPQPARDPSPLSTSTVPPEAVSDPVIKEMPPQISKEALDEEINAALTGEKEADKTTAIQFDAQVNKLFDELKELPEEKPPAPAAADVPPHAPTPAAQINVGAIAAELDQSTTNAERAALKESAAPHPAPAPDAAPSVLVRTLEIVNAPVHSIPSSLRDALGKIAILTLMNAIGVFLYLMLFRR